MAEPKHLSYGELRDQKRSNAGIFLGLLKAEYDAGDVSALAKAIYWAASFNVPLPLWAAYAFQTAYLKKSGSWNDVLGPLRGKGGLRSPDQDELMWQIWDCVHRNLETDGTAPLINDGLFSDVARELGLPEDQSARVRHLYYEAIRWGREVKAMCGESPEGRQQMDDSKE